MIKRLAGSKYPFSVFLRWIVLIGVALRVATSALMWSRFEVEPWLAPLFLFVVYASSLTYLVGRHPALQKDRWVFLFELAADTIFCSVFFSLGGNVDSDLYLNYILPIVVVIEANLSPAATIGYYGLICAAFFVSLTWIDATCTVGCSYLEIIVRGFFPRLTMGLIVIIFSLVRRTRLEES